MCGRATLKTPAQRLQTLFPTLHPPAELQPRYNIAPTQPLLTVLNDGSRQMQPIRWGLIPHWAKDAKIASQLINARSEGAASKPVFRDALKQRRCLIIVDGFYEWRHEPGTKKKTPLYFQMKDGNPFALAGLWSTWKPPDQDAVLKTCTILTTSANELIKGIHERMPVILPASAFDSWLDPAPHDAKEMAGMLVPYPADDMKFHPVAPLVNKVGNDQPALIEPVEIAHA